MCATCGCGTTETADQHDHRHHDHLHAHDHDHAHHHEPTSAHAPRLIRLEQDVLAKNDAIAARNRMAFQRQRIVAFNLTSSPGSGKTTLLEALIRRLGGQVKLSVLEGDQETERDAERIRSTGAAVVQINTGTGCHLDAEMVERALVRLAPAPRSLLLIENVGNLVCPALFDLGEKAKIVVMSVTEGEDKPLKYPHMFRAADILVLTKIDLLPHLDFDVEQCLANARRINPGLRVFRLSARDGVGMQAFTDWIAAQTSSAEGAAQRHAGTEVRS
jgi:hydrogenase nickel incorporation protein HypB